MTSDYDFESSDILGGSLPVGPRRVAQNSGFSSFFMICALGASTLLLLLAFRHGRTFFLRWKERHYKLYAPSISISCSILNGYLKDLCVDDTVSRIMTSDPSMSPMLPLDLPRTIVENWIDGEMYRRSISQILSASGQQYLVWIFIFRFIFTVVTDRQGKIMT